MFRTLYVGATLLGCLLEVLADFRPDLVLAGALAVIDDDDDDDYPTAAAGSVPSSWLAARAAGTAMARVRQGDAQLPSAPITEEAQSRRGLWWPIVSAGDGDVGGGR